MIGAGLPRTGTRSLKEALERLLPGPCYHMHEVFEHPDHVPFWRAAIRGDTRRLEGLHGAVFGRRGLAGVRVLA